MIRILNEITFIFLFALQLISLKYSSQSRCNYLRVIPFSKMSSNSNFFSLFVFHFLFSVITIVYALDPRPRVDFIVKANPQDLPQCPPNGQHYFPDLDNCQAYYFCTEGTLHYYQCPTGTLWNQDLLICDHPQNVNCNRPTTTTTARPSTSTTIGTTTSEPTIDCPPEGIDYFEYPGNCSLYFICIEGSPFIEQCAQGLLFSPELKKCDREENVECGDRTNAPTTISTITPDPELFTCPPNLEFIYMTHPTTCSLFYWCEFGEFKGISNCGVNLWFDFKFQACVSPYESDCDKEPLPPTEATLIIV